MKEVIYSINNCDFKDIEIKQPVKTEENNYKSKLSVYIQTPKLKIEKINDKSISLLLSDEFIETLDKFDSFLIEEISRKSDEFFDNALTKDEFEEIYKPSYHKNKMILKYSNNIDIYTNSKKDLKLEDLKRDNEIIAIINCSKIIYYKTYCFPYWEIEQIKLKKKKEQKNKLDYSSYLFLQDDAEQDNVEEEIKLKSINFKE